MRLAAAYVANDNLDKATATVMEALKVTPTNLAARALLGEIFMRTARLADALALASEIQSNRPKAPLGYKMEGDALMARKDFSRAAAAFQKAASLEPSGTLFIKVHQAQSAAQGGYASDAALRNWIASHPDDTEVRLYLTDALSGAGRYREAIDLYMEVLKRIPQSAQALNNLAWALHAAGDPRALEYARQAVKLKPKNASAVDTLGWILFGHGNAVEGVQTLLNAVALDGADPTIRYHLAQALIKVGDIGRAKSELKTVVVRRQAVSTTGRGESIARAARPLTCRKISKAGTEPVRKSHETLEINQIAPYRSKTRSNLLSRNFTDRPDTGLLRLGWSLVLLRKNSYLI